MFVGQAQLFKFGLELFLIHFCKHILEHAVVGFEDGVLGGKVNGELAVPPVGEGGTGKSFNGSLGIVHSQCNSGALEVMHIQCNGFASIVGYVVQGDFAGTGNFCFRSAVDVPVSMAANDNGLGPVWYQTRHIGADNGFTKNGAIQNVTDGAVGRTIHSFKTELRHPRLVRCNGRAFDRHPVALCGFGSINRNLIIGGIAVFNTQIVVFEVNIQIRQDQPFADEVPDNTGHFIPVHFHNRVFDLDFSHA